SPFRIGGLGPAEGQPALTVLRTCQTPCAGVTLATRLTPSFTPSTLTTYSRPMNCATSISSSSASGRPARPDNILPAELVSVGTGWVTREALQPACGPDRISNSNRRPGPYSMCTVFVTPTNFAR